MSRDSWPDDEFGMLASARNFLAVVSLDPQAYGFSAEKVAQAQDALDAFSTSLFRMAESNAGRGDRLRKNADMRRLENTVRPMRRLVSAQDWHSEADRSAMGLSIAPRVSPRIGVPGEAPVLYLQPMSRGASIRLCKPDGTALRGRPRGVKGAMIFFGVSDSPSAAPTNWTFIEITSKVRLRVELPMSVPGGSVVFFNACWLSPTLKCGPMSQSPRSIRVMDGLGTPSAIRKAA